MTVDSSMRALAAAQAWLAQQDQPEAAICACESAMSGCEAEAVRRVQGILQDQRPSGSWDEDLMATSHALLAIQELRDAGSLAERAPEINGGLAWLRGRQGAPGAWTDGCSEDRHQRGYCHHFAAGFFSPAPPDSPLREAWLANGLKVTQDGDIRFIASTVALRAALNWGLEGSDFRLHLQVLRQAVGDWARRQPPPGLGSASLLAATHALLASTTAADLEAAERGLHLVAARQRGDGSWADTDAFQALEVLEAASRVGIGDDVTRRAVRHGARLLVASQQADGSWGRAHGARRALIAWRTLRRLSSE